MRAVLMLTISMGIAWAQPAPGSAEYNQQQADKVREAVAQLDALRARLAQQAAIKAEEAADQAKLEELRKRYTENHPAVAAAKATLEALRAREAAAEAEKRAALESMWFETYPPGRGLQIGLPDLWWRNPAAAQYLGLTADQQKKMDDVFQQSKSRLRDLTLGLEREEAVLEPLVATEPPDEAKIGAQIDRVAQARAELEKANGRMLLGIRKVLVPGQWTRLNQISSLAQPPKK